MEVWVLHLRMTKGQKQEQGSSVMQPWEWGQRAEQPTAVHGCVSVCCDSPAARNAIPQHPEVRACFIPAGKSPEILTEGNHYEFVLAACKLQF